MQSFTVGHDTPASGLFCVPFMASTAAGFGVAWTRQLVPFQRSANDIPGWGAGAGDHCPTAVHARGVAHDTPPSRVPFGPFVPTGLGVTCMSHTVPFQCSANVKKLNAPST